MNNDIPRFLSIRGTAKATKIPEGLLRKWEKQGKLPCVYSGKKCLINFDRLVEMLNDPQQMKGANANE